MSQGVVEGPSRPRVDLGAEITVRVTADVADEVHVHGYDVFADVAPGAPAEMTLTTDIPGIFEVELESSGLVLFDLQVG